MAESICVRCGQTRFEMKEAPSINDKTSHNTWFFVQCANCGGVVGVLDYFAHQQVVERLERIEKAMPRRRFF